MSSLSIQPWAAGEKKGGIAEVVFPAQGERLLGHCKRCNVLSRMWSAIGTSA